MEWEAGCHVERWFHRATAPGTASTNIPRQTVRAIDKTTNPFAMLDRLYHLLPEIPFLMCVAIHTYSKRPGYLAQFNVFLKKEGKKRERERARL